MRFDTTPSSAVDLVAERGDPPLPCTAVPRQLRRIRAATIVALLLGLVLSASSPLSAARRFPNVLIITLDTLRADRLSREGYERPTSPRMDALMARGAAFDQARVVEPLTAPSLCSMLTSRYPHEHGASRNGLKMRPGLPSLGTILGDRGYKTAAFVGNWTLRDKLSGLGEHFESYNEVLTKKRWLGLFLAEATAEDLNEGALAWLDRHHERDRHWPFLLWVHYVEPHAPYHFHKSEAKRIGLDARKGRDASPSDRYDTEVAFLDRAVGELLDGVARVTPAEDLLVILAADHGESLGEHDYWGHGRHLYDVTLRVPMALIWKGRIEPRRIDDLASNLDLAPTVLRLLGLPTPESFQGRDWTAYLAGETERPPRKATWHQAHRGAARNGGADARRRGLLEVGVVTLAGKEVFSVRRGKRRSVFDLTSDPAEMTSRVTADSSASEALMAWLERVREGLDASDRLPPPSIDAESLEQLKALGYID